MATTEKTLYDKSLDNLSEHHESEEHLATTTGLDSRKLVIWLFIASEVLFFTGLISTYLVYRGAVPREQGVGHLDLTVASINTFILLMSSMTMVTALAAIRDGKTSRMRLWLIATAVLGLVFLGGQVYEYSLLFNEGVSLGTNLFSSTFFTTTGFHGTHVLIGVIWIVSVLLRAFRGGVTPENNLSVEMVGLYWHFVDIVWVVLFTVIYLI
ncbi:MAG: heme-copper oxidase subunit III [Anaerolineae bacterium]